METFHQSLQLALETLHQHYEQEKQDLYSRITELEQYADVSIIKSLSDELHVLKMENTTLKRRLKNDDTRSYLSEKPSDQQSVRTERTLSEPIRPLPIDQQSVRTLPVDQQSVRTLPVDQQSVRTLPVDQQSVRTESGKALTQEEEKITTRKPRGRPVVVKPKKTEKDEEAEREQLRQEAEREERARQEAHQEQLRQESEKEEQLRQEAEREEQLRQEAEREEQLRQEAHQEQLRQEAHQEQLRQEAEREEQLRQEVHQEQLRQEAEREEQLRQEAEREDDHQEEIPYKAVKIKGVQYYTHDQKIYDADYVIVGRIEQGRARFNK